MPAQLRPPHQPRRRRRRHGCPAPRHPGRPATDVGWRGALGVTDGAGRRGPP